MTWICPHCGYEHPVDPLNGRHIPLCKGCGGEYEVPADVKKRIKESIANYRAEMKDLMEEAINLRGEISFYKGRISSLNTKLADLKKQYGGCKKELEMLEKKVVYGCDQEPDRIEQRTARARLDIHQVRLNAPPNDDCPHCNGTGLKRWGNLGVRACVKCKGTGKKVMR